MDREWNFLDAGEHSGQFNMDSDTSLAETLLQGSGFPTLRLYTWKPRAISWGYNQNSSEIDVGSCKKAGIDIVRRPTGGRAILHAEELTYAVAMPSDSPSILASYNSISRALLRGLSVFGVDATFEQSQPRFREAYKTPSSIPCFSSSARYEIEWNGKKLIGSAQRRFANESGEVVLQHGSILCGTAHRQLADYLQLENHRVRKDVQSDLEEKTIDLCEISGQPINFIELSGCIKKGFEQSWGVTFTDIDLMAGARKEAYA